MKIITLFSIFSIVAVLLGTAPLALAGSVPAFHFPFDEGQGMTSKDVAGKVASISGGAGWVSGKVGNAVGFDGTANQNVVLGEDIIPSGIEGTVMFWVKVNAHSNNNFLFSTRNPSDEKKFWTIASDLEGRLMVRYRTGSGATEQKNETPFILDKNTWYHITMTANSQKYLFYVNGVEVLSGVQNIGKWPADFLPGNLRVTVGALDAYERIGVMDGFIDDVRVFGSVLSQAEIEAIFNETNEGGPSIPLGAQAGLTLSVSDAIVDFGGSVKVSWNAANAASCSASWGDAIGVSGEKLFVKLAEPLTVSVTCISTKGVAEVQSFTVNLAKAPVIVNLNGTTPPPKAIDADKAATIASIEKQIAELVKIVATLVEELKKLLAARA